MWDIIRFCVYHSPYFTWLSSGFLMCLSFRLLVTYGVTSKIKETLQQID